MKMDNMLSGAGISLEWTFSNRLNNLELIDYAGVEIDYKPTIFSGAN